MPVTRAGNATRRRDSWVRVLALLASLAGCTPTRDEPERAAPAPPAGAASGIPGAGALGVARSALVSSTTIDALGDTYLRSGSPNQNAGGDTVLSLQASGARRALLFFDKPAIVAAVGSGSLVSARIELTIFSAASNWGSSGRPISLHRLKQTSAEYQATWACALDANVNNQQADCSGSNVWNMSSNDPAVLPWTSTASATAAITNNQTGVVAFDVSADVTGILNGSWPGYGWLLKKVDEGQSGAVDFASRERTPAPRLVLEINSGSSGGGGLGPITGSASVAPQSDTHIRQGAPNQNYSSENFLRIQASGRNRGLIAFDLPAISSALGGPLIRARLRLPILKTYPNWGPDRTLGAHHMLRSWVDAAATWNCSNDANPGNQSPDCSGSTAWVMWGPGIDVPWASPPTATVLVASEETGTLEFDLTHDVACALAGHVALNGWLIKKAMENQAGKVELFSRESASPPSLFLEWTNTNGVTVTAAECTGTPAGGGGGCTPSATLDQTCNGIDDDCDGLVDDDFSVQATSCGVGACASSGESSCVTGQVVDNCVPGAPAASDATCNGIDDDCNGTADEDFVPSATACGVGACARTGMTSCVAGHVADSCARGAPSGNDDNCNGIDEDCDGSPDDGFVSTPTSCPSGACQATGVTTCQQGVLGCTPQALLPVDDGNPCTTDVCIPAQGPTYTPRPTGTLCLDQNLCNGSEACNAAGVCAPGTPLVIDDGNPCTLDACDPLLGPSHVAVAAGTGCDDGNPCNGIALCNGSGSCVSGSPPSLDDGNPCTADSCDPGSGVRHDPAPAGTNCADSNVCNGAESCDGAGHCAPGLPVDVNDQNPCTVDFCDPVRGVVHQPGQVRTCDDDGNVCNGTAFCGPLGECVHDTPPTIDDGDPCTNDFCDPVQGVYHDFRPPGVECDDGNICNGISTCDAVGACIAGASPTIDDGDPCTIDSCFPSTGIVHVAAPPGTACTWGDRCYAVGSCNEEGTCVQEALPLDDGDPCTADTCDPAEGIAHVPWPIPDDLNPCTVDACDPTLGVVYTPLPEGAPCSDGDPCNGAETCHEGYCASQTTPDSDDGNPCTVDLCDGETGEYQHLPAADGTRCDDETICGQGGVCFGGDCMLRGPLIDDGDTCTQDICHPEIGVVEHVPADPGSPCDNQDACDGVADVCDADGACVGTEEIELPEPSGPCMASVCDPRAGVQEVPAPEGVPCGQGAICDGAGTCVPGPSLDCQRECAILEVVCPPPDPNVNEFPYSNYALCTEKCSRDSTGPCAEAKQANQQCLFENPTDCAPSECAQQRQWLENCLSAPPDPEPGVINDCVSTTVDGEGTLQYVYADFGTICEGPYSCGVGYCDYGECVVDDIGLPYQYAQPQCMTPSGPGFCSGAYSRTTGTCQPGLNRPSPCFDTRFNTVLAPGTPCSLGVCSQQGVCDRFGRCLAPPSPGGTPCEDKSLCTGPGTCGMPQPDLQFQRDHSFECIPDHPQVYDVSDPCGFDACNPVTGQVEHQPQPAGTSCDDGNPCNGVNEVCDGSDHCLPGTQIPVDDGNPCTIDYACDPQLGYRRDIVPDGTSCSDGDPCNGEEVCVAGVCGTAEVAPVGPCFVRSCDPETGIVETPRAAGSPCEPSHTPCLHDGVCDGAGHCQAPQPVAIDDQNLCTIDSCDLLQGVQHVYYLPDDANPCTVAECDPITGPVQLPVSAGSACSDGDACNGEETCDGAGSCVAGMPVAVDDGNPCTLDRCDSLVGVVHEALRGGASCSDGNLCNGEELCDGAGHCAPGVAPPVDDQLICTDDSCDPAIGVMHHWVGGPDCTGPRWSMLAGSAPSPRDSSAATFLPLSSELFLFGGENAGVALADTWLFDREAKTWRSSFAAPPPARAGAAAVYSELNGRVIVFGGASVSATGTAYLGDLWEYDPVADAWDEIDADTGPEPRTLAAMSYDVERERVVLFGGVGSSGALQDTWEFDTLSRSWSARSSQGPSARGGAAMAYDPVRQRMVLFGGAPQPGASPGAPLADLWEFDGAAGLWSERSTTNAPPARTGHALVYDVGRQRFRLFGGTGAEPGAFADTWEFDSTAALWQPLAPALSLPGRAGHAIGYDPLSGSTLVAAGLDYSANGTVTPASSEVWQLDQAGSRWRELTAHTVPITTQSGLAYDHARGALVSVGPLPATDRLVAWEFSASTELWQPRELLAQDNRLRFDGQLVTLGYDLDRQRPLIGGYGPGRYLGDADQIKRLWEWDGTHVTRGCDVSSIVSGANLLYDPVHRRLLAIGGTYGAFEERSEFWQLDLGSCAVSRRRRDGPLTGPALTVWDSQRGRVIVHTQHARGGRYVETWVSDPALEIWTRLQPTSHPPLSFGAGMAYDPLRGRVVWFGPPGSDEAGQTWELDSQAGQWQAIAGASGPKPPVSASFDAARGNVVVLDAEGTLWDYVTGSWHPREFVLTPPARNGASAAWIPEAGYAVLFGGVSGSGQRRLLGDTWLWRNGWKPASDVGVNESQRIYGAIRDLSPQARTGHTLIASDDVHPEFAALLFGGEGEAGLLGDTWAFNRDTYQWTPIESIKIPARTGHAMALLPHYGYLLFGGLSASGPLNDTWTMRIVDNETEWHDRQGEAALAPRWGHAMATDLDRGTVLLFGGRDRDNVLGDTWEYRPGAEPRWIEHHPRIFPPARFGHTLVYDPVRHRIVLTGGSGAAPGSTFDDTWDWDAPEDTWIHRTPERASPARAGRAAFFDASRAEVVAFGGLAYADQGRAAVTFADTFALENASVTVDQGVRLPMGARCAHPEECETGQCVDGYCCNSSCTGQCGACNLPGEEGHCSAVLGAPHGARPACPGSDQCQKCGGVQLDACGAADGLSCYPGACVGGTLYSPNAQCVDGVCEGLDPHSCAPYTCRKDGKGCADQCYRDSECYSSDYFCLNPPYLPMCVQYAKVAQVSVPAPLHAGTSATLRAWVTRPPADFTFSYLDAQGTKVVACSTRNRPSGECELLPTQAGTTQWRVEVHEPGSRKSVDDFRDFEVTVLP